MPCAGLDPDHHPRRAGGILTRLKARNIAVLLCGMLAPPNYGADYAARFNAIYPELAKAFGVPLYPFFLDGVAADKKLNQADGMHPTAEASTSSSSASCRRWRHFSARSAGAQLKNGYVNRIARLSPRFATANASQGHISRVKISDR